MRNQEQRGTVLEAEKARRDLVRTWYRTITFYGTTEYTFRPDGYYIQKNMPLDTQSSLSSSAADTYRTASG